MKETTTLLEAKEIWSVVEEKLNQENIAPVITEQRKKHYQSHLSEDEIKVFDKALKERADPEQLEKKKSKKRLSKKNYHCLSIQIQSRVNS